MRHWGGARGDALRDWEVHGALEACVEVREEKREAGSGCLYSGGPRARVSVSAWQHDCWDRDLDHLGCVAKVWLG